MYSDDLAISTTSRMTSTRSSSASTGPARSPSRRHPVAAPYTLLPTGKSVNTNSSSSGLTPEQLRQLQGRDGNDSRELLPAMRASEGLDRTDPCGSILEGTSALAPRPMADATQAMRYQSTVDDLNRWWIHSSAPPQLANGTTGINSDGEPNFQENFQNNINMEVDAHQEHYNI